MYYVRYVKESSHIESHQGTTANADQQEVGASGEPTAKMDDQDIARNNEQISNEQPNVIPTSPQYGVAIIPESAEFNHQLDSSEPPKANVLSTVVEDSTKSSVDPQSTTSRNDRFKVVKIASLEPFKRGRWKCMDYMDECPPGTTPVCQSKTQSTTNLQTSTGGPIFMQTQSLPQQQFQQILMQGGVYQNTQTGHFFPNQIVPNQTQYFYATQQQNSVSQQLVGVPQFVTGPQFYAPVQTGQPNSGIPNQTAFAVPAGYQNTTLQYVPIQQQTNGSSAFVPTSQQQQIHLLGYQQGQTYAGQHQQPLVNGHSTASYPAQQQNTSDSTTTNQMPASSMANQTAKSVIINQTATTATVVSSQVPVQVTGQPIQLVANQTFQPTAGQFHQQGQQSNITIQQPSQPQVSSQQMFKEGGIANAATSSVYTNPQFATSVNSLAGLGGESSELSDHNLENQSVGDAVALVDPLGDDPARTNPVVNAIDNKIEQAMDLVKSHLMYTVREEVEVLKEKIAELMERIQQLETENNYLRSQIPKNQQSAVGNIGQNGSTASNDITTPTQQPPTSQQQ